MIKQTKCTVFFCDDNCKKSYNMTTEKYDKFLEFYKKAKNQKDVFDKLEEMLKSKEIEERP
jgi:predicted DNA-binding protein YlxM (UPF0122 family)